LINAIRGGCFKAFNSIQFKLKIIICKAESFEAALEAIYIKIFKTEILEKVIREQIGVWTLI